ncbi:MAG: transposase, partial [Methanoregula sp.]|nr:transposase [Methanoregula sp.]
IRIVLVKDVPEIFSGTVEVDETYVGGQWKNKRKTIRDHGTKRGRDTKKQPVFGILCRNGQVWAEVVTMLKMTRFSHISQEKYQQDLPFVLILGKPILELPPEDMSIVSSIMVKRSTVMEMEIISMG